VIFFLVDETVKELKEFVLFKKTKKPDDKGPSKIKEDDETNEDFICNTCNEKFPLKRFLEAHLLVSHHPLRCDVCGLNFNIQDFLLAHLKTRHPSELVQDQIKKIQYERVTCPKCKKRVSMAQLRDHNEIYHTKIECGLCGVVSDDIRSYRKHENEHKKNGAFKCEECGTGFKNRKNLKKHAKKHEPDYVKVFPCKICKCILSTRFNLARHLKTVHCLHHKTPALLKLCRKSNGE